MQTNIEFSLIKVYFTQENMYFTKKKPTIHYKKQALHPSNKHTLHSKNIQFIQKHTPHSK